MEADITVTAPANYEVSTDDSAFASSVTLTQSAGEVANTTVYVRLQSALAGASYSGNVDLASTNATTQSIAVSGTVEAPLAAATLPYTESFDNLDGVYTYNVAGSKTYDLNAGSNSNASGAHINSWNEAANEAWLILPAINLNNYANEILTFKAATGYYNAESPLQLYYSTDYAGVGSPASASWTELTHGITLFNMSAMATSSNIDLSGVSGTAVYVAFKHTGTTNHSEYYIDDISIQEVAGASVSVSTNSISGLDYNATAGPSAASTFNVSGLNLTADITLTVTGDFEIAESTDGTYGANITLTQTAGSVANTTIYVRLKAGLSENSYNGSVTVSSTGVTDETITLAGTVNAAVSSLLYSNDFNAFNAW